MEIIVIPAHRDHIFWLANNMRKADLDECAAGGMGPCRALKTSLERSAVAWTGMIMPDARPMCMFGAAPLDILGGVGSPWLLGTEEIREHAVSFLRSGRRYVGAMLELFPTLINYVDERNDLSIKWLKWLGFKLDEKPTPYGTWNQPFHRFELRQCA